METHLKSVGLDRMPSKWYQQAQLALWPNDEPCDPFLHCGILLTIQIKIKRIKRMVLVGNCTAKDPIPDDKAKVMAENFKKGGHIKVLAQVLWDWQEERSLSIHPLPFTLSSF